jgi:hypothetical protein
MVENEDSEEIGKAIHALQESVNKGLSTIARGLIEIHNSETGHMKLATKEAVKALVEEDKS